VTLVLTVLAVTVEGKVYSCGEATNGRLGLGMSSGTVPIPRQITALSSYVVKKVAVHSGMYISEQFLISFCSFK
jgi:E3 ubiquitin-protein ligase HERC2